MESLRTDGYTVMNTRFEKPAEKLVTYKEKVPQHNPEREEYEGENARPIIQNMRNVIMFSLGMNTFIR